MRLAPDEESRAEIKFWLDCLQVVIVIAGIVGVYLEFKNYAIQQEQRVAEQAERAEAQEQHAKTQLEATMRELERPYQERKLDLYLEAARVLAHLASSPDVDKEQTEARFWELYWGELAFVESKTTDEPDLGGRKSVERLMVDFCHTYFSPERCTAPGSATGSEKTRRTRTEQAAIKMARQASSEIRDRWERLGEK